MKKKITAIIVDDEDHGRHNLRALLQKTAPTIHILAEAGSIRSLNKSLAQLQPDVLFLDIKMRGPSGLDFLECTPDRPYEVILVTAFNQHGLRALKSSVLDYILKPIDPEELMVALDKLKRRLQEKAQLQRSIRTEGQQIHVPHAKGVSLFDPQQIIRIKADNNYVTLYLLHQPSLTIAKTIKEFDQKLTPLGFFRVHKSHLINLKHIQSYSRAEGGELTMIDGQKLSIAKRRLGAFHQFIKTNSILIK